jgi:HAE1 family hydrophobic/amphiphilic exporter-1
MFDVFVKRPILSGAIAALILLAGIASIFTLPIAQYPQITPPQVVVTSTYIGADSQTVESAVTTPLEEQINGVQGMSYISSTSSDAGVSTITITFDPSRDIDAAAVDVQNRVQDASGELPASVTQAGIQITKTAGGFVMAIAFTSKNKAETLLDLSNYLDTNVVDPLQRINGVSSATVFGERKYAMRIWLDPNKLQQYGLGPTDVTTAVANQNVEVPAGQVGAAPEPATQATTINVHVPGQLASPSDFGAIIVKPARTDRSYASRKSRASNSARKTTRPISSLTAPRRSAWASSRTAAPTPSKSRATYARNSKRFRRISRRASPTLSRTTRRSSSMSRCTKYS